MTDFLSFYSLDRQKTVGGIIRPLVNASNILKQILPEIPIVNFRRPKKSIKDILVRVKLRLKPMRLKVYFVAEKPGVKFANMLRRVHICYFLYNLVQLENLYINAN